MVCDWYDWAVAYAGPTPLHIYKSAHVHYHWPIHAITIGNNGHSSEDEEFMSAHTCIGIGIFYATVLAPVAAFGGDRITGRAFATRSEVFAQHGMAATSQPLVTQIALDILKKGGSAIDAAIAADAALGLMEPVGSGIGGDLFAIVWDAKTQKLYGLNASGRSPQALTLEEFRNQDLQRIPRIRRFPIA